MTNEKPILFSGAMVRAILAGLKTQTRRVIKGVNTRPDDYRYRGFEDGRWFFAHNLHSDGDLSIKCPYPPGTRLWVKETYAIAAVARNKVQINYMADDKLVVLDNPGYDEREWAKKYERRGPRPSLFMPRWASRITLEVTEARVERVQEISDADAQAEGVTSRPSCYGYQRNERGWSSDWSRVGELSLWAESSCDSGKRVEAPLTDHDIALGSARYAFAELWDSINGKGAWDSNPWVWAYTFKVLA